MNIIEENEKNIRPDWGSGVGITSLWTEVQDGLWVGGTEDNDTVFHSRETYDEKAYIGPEDFDSVATLYAWASPVDWLVEEYRFGIFDGGNYYLNIQDVKDLVVWVHGRWKSGKKTLVRCQAGLSRSTFITALVLVRDGYSVEDAVKLIRDRRSQHCLTLNGSAEGGKFSDILYDSAEAFWRE